MREKKHAAPRAKIIPIQLDAAFFYERAVRSLDRCRYDKALRYFRKAVEYEPDNPVNHCNMAGILSEMGNYEESNNILRRVLDELDPGRVAAEVMTHAFGRYPLPAEIAGVVGMRHLLDGLPPAQRIGVRQLGSARHANATRPAATDLPRPDTAWSLRWAKVTRHVLHLTLADHGGPVHTLAVFPGPDGNALLAACNLHGTVWIWDPTTASALAVLISHPGEVQEMTAFPGPGGHALLATGGRDGTVRIWDVATGTTKMELYRHHSWVEAMTAFTGLGGHILLATSSLDSTVRIWNATTGTTQALLTGYIGSAWAMAALLGPDGRSLLATCDEFDRTVRVWDVATWSLLHVLRVDMAVYGLAPVEAGLAVAGSEGIVVVDLHPGLVTAR